MLGRMLSDIASKIDNNAPDDKPDVQESVGNFAQDVARASNSWKQADGDQRSIQPLGNVTRGVAAASTGGDKSSIEPVGNLTKSAAAASGYWRQADGGQRSIHAGLGKFDICSRRSSLTYCVVCGKKVCGDDKFWCSSRHCLNKYCS